MSTALTYTAKPARYAKNHIAVDCRPVDGGMWKCPAAIFAGEVHARYSNREHSYIMTPGQFKRFEALAKGTNPDVI